MTRLWSSCLVVALLVLGTVVVGGRGAAQEREFINPATALPAANGTHYVCESRLYPPNYNGGGDHGYLFVRFHDAPNCGGEPIGFADLFSEGATHQDSHSTWLYSAASLIAYAQMTQRAAVFGEKVAWARCSVLKDRCLQLLTFRGDF